MKTFNALPVAVLPLLLAGALVAEESRIHSVELHPRGATVIREVVLELPVGESQTVEVRELPSALSANSIQIAMAEGSGLRLGGFTFLPNENPVEEDDERTSDLRESIESLEESLRRIRLEESTIADRIAFHKEMAQSIRKSLEEGADTGRFELSQSAWETAEGVRTEGENRLAVLATEARGLTIERDRLKQDLHELVAALNQRAGVLRVDITGSKTEEARLFLRYQVREAGWQPVHEIRAEPAQGTVAWTYKARLWQHTGEDWENVPVVLNSAQPVGAGGLPELDPLFLERQEVRPLAQAKAESMRFAAADMDMAPPAYGEAERSSTTTGFLMELADTVTVKSGEAPVVKAAFSGDLEAEFWTEAVPEYSTEAWLMAGMTNELDWPILGGEAFFFVDGQLVANRHIQTIPAGENTEMALGRNEKIVIERKERKREESEGGLIDRTKRHQIKYETTVTNRMPVAHRIVLQDRFPVGRDNKIQIRISSPSDVTPEEGTGIFKWERTLEPGSEAVLNTEYTVTYPADWTIWPPL